MGKGEVEELLEKEKRWMSTKEVSKILDKSPSTTSRLLNALITEGVAFTEIKIIRGSRVPHYKIL